MTELTAIFQLHHTGIKTSVSRSHGANRDSFQLHHTGIKTFGDCVLLLWRGGISIAPYRN